MRKPILLLFFFCSFLSVLSFGQNKLEGIGKFKIKKTTTAYLDTLSKEQDFERTTIKSFMDNFMLTNQINKIAEIFPDTVNTYNSPPNAHYSKDVRAFYIPTIKISEIDISNTYLIFYKDTLVGINTNYTSEIADAFEVKYGNPAISKMEKVVKCTLKLTGGIVTYVDTTFYYTWENGEIKCIAAISDYHNSECEKKKFSYISINIEKISQKISDFDFKESERIMNKNKVIQNNEKKKKLTDF